MKCWQCRGPEATGRTPCINAGLGFGYKMPLWRYVHLQVFTFTFNTDSLRVGHTRAAGRDGLPTDLLMEEIFVSHHSDGRQ